MARKRSSIDQQKFDIDGHLLLQTPLGERHADGEHQHEHTPLLPEKKKSHSRQEKEQPKKCQLSTYLAIGGVILFGGLVTLVVVLLCRDSANAGEQQQQQEQVLNDSQKLKQMNTEDSDADSNSNTIKINNGKQQEQPKDNVKLNDKPKLDGKNNEKPGSNQPTKINDQTNQPPNDQTNQPPQKPLTQKPIKDQPGDLITAEQIKKTATKQTAEINTVLKEIKNGKKNGHYVWWMLPTPYGGTSPTSIEYAIPPKRPPPANKQSPEYKHYLKSQNKNVKTLLENCPVCANTELQIVATAFDQMFYNYDEKKGTSERKPGNPYINWNTPPDDHHKFRANLHLYGYAVKSDVISSNCADKLTGELDTKALTTCKPDCKNAPKLLEKGSNFDCVKFSHMVIKLMQAYCDKSYSGHKGFLKFAEKGFCAQYGVPWEWSSDILIDGNQLLLTDI